MGGPIICNTILRFDVFRKDVPFQDAYTVTSFKLLSEYEKIPKMKELLEELRRIGG